VCAAREGCFLSSCVACYQVVYLSQRGTVDVHTKDERTRLLHNIRASSLNAACVISIIDINPAESRVCMSFSPSRDNVCGEPHLFKILPLCTLQTNRRVIALKHFFLSCWFYFLAR